MYRKTKKLDSSFYNRKDVVLVARNLLGKILVTDFEGVRSSGRIVETEAYAGVNDRASHAFGGRRTARSEHLYGAPGTIYVYISYGMHHLFNVITNKKDIPHGVLIRALEPMEGIDHMLERTGKTLADYTLQKVQAICHVPWGFLNCIPEEIYFPKKFILKTMECGTRKIRSQ